jgi:hypothetical protein
LLSVIIFVREVSNYDKDIGTNNYPLAMTGNNISYRFLTSLSFLLPIIAFVVLIIDNTVHLFGPNA